MQNRFCHVDYKGQKKLAMENNGELFVSSLDFDALFTHDLATLHDMFDTKVALTSDEVRYLPPLVKSARIFCVGKNYHNHASEMGGKAPSAPDIFMRVPESFVGHNELLRKPSDSDKFDYEGELAVIIGKGGRRINESQAMDHVFGYTLANDGSIRDWQKQTSQFTLGKNCDESGAMGPYITIANQDVKPEDLSIKTLLNGEIVQNGPCSDMVFSIPTVIERISRSLTLKAGDVILTGTPAGVGAGQNPPVFLRINDTVEIIIEGLGCLKNSVSE